MRLCRRSSALLMVLALTGCGGNREEGLISSTNDQLADASSSIVAITESLKDFMKHKDAKDEEAAKVDVEGATKAAEKLKGTAKKLQEYFRQADKGPAKSEDEKKEFRDANKVMLKETATKINELSERDREFKTVLAEVTKKHTAVPIQAVLKELEEANAQFASITRKR